MALAGAAAAVTLGAIVLLAWFVLRSPPSLPVPSVAVRLPPPPKPAVEMAAAPQPDLVEESRFGKLPKIGRDGRMAWQVYARPFDRADKRPRVAIVISNESDRDNVFMREALKIAGAVTLAFTPYTLPTPGEWLARAREAGHEVLIGVPMEATESAPSDPGGPLTLLTSLDPGSNQERLEKALASGTGYVGVLPLAGGRFLGAAEKLEPMLQILKSRGLLFVDTGAAPQSAVASVAPDLPRARVEKVIDGEGTREGMDRRLAELEDLARRGGAAVGFAQASPASIERIGAWAAQVDKGNVVLAPVSAVVPR